MSTNDAIQVDKFHRACTEMYNFRVPSMKLTTDFKASFKNSSNSEDAINLIEKLILTRTDMHAALISDSPSEAKLAAVDLYLPNILLLMNSLQAQDKITFDKSLNFEWKGALHTDEPFYKSSYITYEVMMVLHTKAILHSNTARHLVDSDPLNFLTDAGKHLLTASSIMQYLHDQLTGPWNGQFNVKLANPNDLNAKVCLALSVMFKGNAQSMAVVKALGNETTPALIKARLAISVINSAKKAGDILSTAVYQGPIVYNFILCFLGVKRELYTVLSFLFLAQSNSEKKEMGMAQGYITAAQRRLQSQTGQQHKPSDFGMPKSQSANLVCAIAVLHSKLEVLYKHVDTENRFIYFQVIPTLLPELPLEASVMNPPVYVQPQYEGAPIVFEYKAPPSMVGSIFSSFMRSGSKIDKPVTADSSAVVAPVAVEEPPVPSALAPPVSSYAQMKEDEEYAKTLQEQYSSADAGEASAHRGPPAANYQAPPGGFQPPAAATTYQTYHQQQQQPAAYQQLYSSACPAPSAPTPSYQYNQPPQQQQQQQHYGSAPPQPPYNPYGSAPSNNGVNYPTL